MSGRVNEDAVYADWLGFAFSEASVAAKKAGPEFPSLAQGLRKSLINAMHIRHGRKAGMQEKDKESGRPESQRTTSFLVFFLFLLFPRCRIPE